MLPPTGRGLSAPTRRRFVAMFLVISLLALTIPLPQRFASFIPAAKAASTSVVISEFRLRGPAGGNDEFIELYNLTDSPINIGGWKINGSNNAGSASTRVTIVAGTVIPARGYFLAVNSNATGGYSGSVAGNQTFGTGITDDGGIALLDAANTIIDQVGLHAGSAYKEGTVLAPLGSTTAANVDRCYERKPGGASGNTQDTDNNAVDFQLIAPCNPQNLSSPPAPSATPAPAPGTLQFSAAGYSVAENGGSVSVTVSRTNGSNGSVSVNYATSDGTATNGLDYVAASGTLNFASGETSRSFNVQILDDALFEGDETVTLTLSSPTGGATLGAQSTATLTIIDNEAAPTPTPTPTPAPTPSPTPTTVPAGAVVISQVYGGGGNSGAPFNADFIEIFNRSTETVTLTNWSVQYTSANGSSWSGKTDFSATLVPGQYFLIQGSGGANGSPLPAPDVTGGINMSGTSGKVALVRNTTTLTGTCPTGNTSVADFIGYGTVNCSLGDDEAPGDNAAPTLSNTTAALRVGDGCNDSQSNAADFSVGAPTPRNSISSLKNCNDAPPPTNEVNSTVVISQVYPGGGNSGALYRNDYVELYNRGTSTVSLGGWSVQYASATGSGWDTNKQPLGGAIAPGEYYLVSLAGGANGISLPPANITGELNMSATAGKVALVKSFDGLVGNCPLNNPNIADFVGYGSTADCGEGNRKAPQPGAANALLRKNDGLTDTDNNQADFMTGAPNPRRSAPIVEIGPYVFGTDPRAGSTTAPRDATIIVNFTEPVEVTGQWFNIQCVTTGTHNDAMVTGGPKTFSITPNQSFINGEQCTVTIYKDAVRDLDTDDSEPDTDNLPADYVWTFTTSTGAPPPFPPSVHLTMGNPTGAVADINHPNNYLMEKPEFALSYNRDKGTPNWVSWHLSSEWTGTLSRFDTFRPDPAVPSDWYRVLATDYSGSGFDRGHMVPNADRNHQNLMPVNQATFLMTNMLPQTPDNNQGPWAAQESYLRTLLPANEVYIIAGGAGTGGTGSNGFRTTIANGRVEVPSHTWKVALVLPKQDGDDISRVTASTRTIAVIMPNTQGIRNDDWRNYLVSVDQVEALTGYDFFSNLPDEIENSIEAGVDGNNPPGVADQSVITDEDTPAVITLAAASANNNPLTYTVLTQPTRGTLTGTGANRIYTPAPDFFGTDSFTYRVNDGQANSNTATVTITVMSVNDAPVISNVPFTVTIDELSLYTFTATASDVDVPAQALTFSLVGAPAGAVIDAATGQFTWTPTEEQGGTGVPFNFAVRVSDGVTETDAPISITVREVNQAPTLAPIGNLMVALGGSLNFTAVGMDGDLPAQALSYSLNGAVPAGAFINSTTGVFNWTPTSAHVGRVYTFNVRVTDDGSGNLFAEERVSVAVAYSWSNLLEPINPNGSSVFKAGSTVPVRFRLTGATAGVTNANAKLLVAKINGDTIGAETDAVSTSGATTDNLFRYDASDRQYIFNLNTKGMTAGAYQLRVDMGDGVTRVVNITLRD